MEGARAVQGTIGGVRARINAAQLGVQSEATALQVALVGATRNAEDLGEFVFPTPLVRRRPPYERLQLTTHEFRALFGVGQPLLLEFAPIDEAVGSEAFRAFAARMETALRCTLAEAAPCAAWKRPRARAAAYLAMHMHEPLAALGAVLGGVVHAADNRRVEDLAAHVDDAEPETMLLGGVVVALCSSVVAG